MAIKQQWENSLKTGKIDPALLEYLKTQPKYSTQANLPNAKLKVGVFENSRGFANRTIFLNGIPIPKSSAFPKKKKSPKRILMEALRNSVTEQILDFRKNQQLPVECYLTGKQLKKWSEIDIDHKGLPFADIAEMWIALQDKPVEKIRLKGAKTNKVLASKKELQSWCEHHKKLAHLVPTDKSANRAKGRKII